MKMRNQFILAPLKLGYSDDSGEINEKHLQFYVERSKYIGAATLEPFYLDKGLREIPTQIGINDNDKLPGLMWLVEAIKKEGAKVVAHLNHPGRMVNPQIPGNYYISSTDQPCENGGVVPRRMENADMAQVKRLYVDAAVRAKKAGFDFIELQFGHGYLFSQFLSPAVNNRDDEYDGSFDNRSRFPIAVFDAVKEAVDLPLIVRVSGEEMIPTGIKIEETLALVKLLEIHGAAAVHVSAGTVCSTPPWFFQHMFIPKGQTWKFASKIKEQLKIPVIFVGRINSKADVDKLRNEYHAEYIALGRALIADPDFAGKYLGQLAGFIRPCLACSEGCLGGVRSGKGLGCVVNPTVGQKEIPLQAAAKSKYLAVVGGGLAGMEVSLTLKKRGHKVDLYEKDKLGGQFNLACLPPNKGSLKEIIDYYENEIKENELPVFYQEATADKLIKSGYDGIIIATGARPAIPPIDGLKEYFWAEFMLDENLPQNKKVVIIGGGLIGIEIASKLVDKGNEVIIVEMLDEAARGMEMIEKKLTIEKLKSKGVPIYLSTRVEKIEGSSVRLSGFNEKKLEDVDHIVIAAGMKSYHLLFDELKDKLPVILIGDAKNPGNAQDAIREAYVTALEM